LAEINNTIASMDATLVMVVSAALLEKLPNTYPIINTIHAANNTLIKMISPKGIVLNFNGYKILFILLNTTQSSTASVQKILRVDKKGNCFDKKEENESVNFYLLVIRARFSL
jgi:hypothetical protein